VGGACGSNRGEDELVGKPEVKRPILRSRRRCVDNIKVDLVEIGLVGLDLIALSQDR
jgi:hypothetical protein